jgi:hypothetical protein
MAQQGRTVTHVLRSLSTQGIDYLASTSLKSPVPKLCDGRVRGYTAGSDWLRVATADDVSLALIDVMLAVADVTSTRFSAERTDAYLQTGLRLLEDLAEANPTVFPARAVFLTNTASEGTLLAAHRTGDALGVPVWQKAASAHPTTSATPWSTAFDCSREHHPTVGPVGPNTP